MKPFLLAISCWLLSLGLQAQHQPTYWQQRTDYQIRVRLDDTAHALLGDLTLTYHNQSTDTLHFIWMHLWPNAYKNDRTAFAEQSLLAGSTDFYFSKPEDRGYINRINFTANGVAAKTEDHPRHIDLVKVLLPEPLLPGKQVLLQTPFYVQLPYLFSRGGHVGQFYAATQWFPKAAVYDANGWHEMPYLYSSEYYANFGNYKVTITVPDNYVVAATGMLQSETEKQWLKQRTKNPMPPAPPKPKQLFKTPAPKTKAPAIATSRKFKTLEYVAEQVVDFAWFADKTLMVKFDTMQVGQKQVEVWNYFHPTDEKNWSASMANTKRAVQFFTDKLGPYPYPQVSVVANPLPSPDGMEYPMITLLNYKPHNSTELDILIAHEVGHNWLQGILASNERDHAWMDEGMVTFYERKYRKQFYPSTGTQKRTRLLPTDALETSLQKRLSDHTDAPIDTPGGSIQPMAYYDLVYTKAANWMEYLEQEVGQEKMDKAMKAYYAHWQFKHPQPADFQRIIAEASGQLPEATFALLHHTGPLPSSAKKTTAFTPLFNLNNTDKKTYIGIAPAIGSNAIDKFEIGLVAHNYNIPAKRFQFVVAPMFATGTKQLVGYAHGQYSWYPSNKKIKKVDVYAGVARFNTDAGTDENGESLPVAFSKIAPGFRLILKPKSSLSTLERSIDFRTFIISEQQLLLQSPPPPGDTVFYASRNGAKTTVIPQLTLSWRNQRALYPWQVDAQLQQVQQIVRTSVTANYFLNYKKGAKGVQFRLFAGKIFYTQEATQQLRNDNSRYHFTMYAPNGIQDYTYRAPFHTRNQSTNFWGRQIAMRDGGFKYRSDYSSVVPGLKTNGADYFDNWLATFNATVDIPDKLNPLAFLPFPINWKIFADAGTSASSWKTGTNAPRFLYSIGLQVPVLRFIHFYYPLIHSDAFNEPIGVNDPFRQGGPLWWQKRLTFSIDTETLSNRLRNFPF